MLCAAIVCGGVLLRVQAVAQRDPDSLLQQARIAEKAGDYAGAARVYQQALSLSPGNLEVLKRFGILEQTELKFDDSIAHFQQVLARNPQFAEVNFFLGVSYLGKNDLPQAIRSFQVELKNAHPHPRCRYYLALALKSSGRMDEAISQLNEAVSENPRDADALYELAKLHKDASLHAIEGLKALDPDSFQLHALMGDIYGEEERYVEAIKEYRSALDKRPGAQGIHYSIGIAYWAQHQLAEAEKEFSQALDENPGDPMVNLYLADIAVSERRFAQALGYLRIPQSAKLNVPQIHLLLGKCYRGQNDLEAAKGEFLEAIKANPTAAEPHYLLAQVYRDLHDGEASNRELAEFERLSKSGTDKSNESVSSIPETK